MVRVAVIGCGLMGVKIAGEFAYYGHRVKCYDNNIQSLNSVYARYQTDKAHLFADQLIESPNFTGQVLCLSRLEETVNDAQLIIECVIEDFEVKSILFEKISTLCPLESIITTVTLRLDVSKLADSVKNKERFLGLRFLYPVYFISEVEITPHKETANWVVEKLRTLLGTMGKTLFFRSGLDPLILSEEKRELRKQQRIDEVRNSNDLSYVIYMKKDSFIPELGRNNQTDLNKLFFRRNNPQEFLNLNEFNKSNKKNGKSTKNDVINVLSDTCDNNLENDCVICMDGPRNSVLRPCNHMVTCYNCSKLLLNRHDNCCVCREKITEIIKIFMS